MKKLITIALTALALHQTSTITINYIDNTEPVYREGGTDHNDGNMNECGQLHTSYNGHLFLATTSIRYYEVYTHDEVYPNQTTQSFNPFDISVSDRMYRKPEQITEAASTLHDGLCNISTCNLWYGDQNAFMTAWNQKSFGDNTIASGIAENPSILYRNHKRRENKDTAGLADKVIYEGSLINNIKTNAPSKLFNTIEDYKVLYDFYNPIFVKDNNSMTYQNFVLATQTDRGTVTLDTNIKYNSILKTATNDTFNTNSLPMGVTGAVYYKDCVVSTDNISTSTSSNYQYIGCYLQNSIKYYVYGTKLSDSIINGSAITAMQAYNGANSSFNQ